MSNTISPEDAYRQWEQSFYGRTLKVEQAIEAIVEAEPAKELDDSHITDYIEPWMTSGFAVMTPIEASPAEASKPINLEELKAKLDEDLQPKRKVLKLKKRATKKRSSKAKKAVNKESTTDAPSN